MTDHADMQKQLAAYCGGDLDPTARRLVEEHLACCASCRAELADLQTTLRLLRTTPGVEPPPWLAARIMARVREQQQHKGGLLQRIFRPLFIRLPLEVMALLVACVSGYYLTRTVEQELKPPAGRLELPAVPATDQPPAAVRQEPPAAAPSPPVLMPPAAAPGRTAAPLDQAAPQSLPEGAGKSSPQPAFAPAPPAGREERAAPAGAVSQDDLQSGSDGQAPKRAGKAAAVTKDKAPAAFRGTAAESAAGTAATATPQLRIRLKLTAPAAAPAALKAAITRVGGSVSDDRLTGSGPLKATVPSHRLDELLDSLARLGTLVERPQTGDLPAVALIEIYW